MWLQLPYEKITLVKDVPDHIFLYLFLLYFILQYCLGFVLMHISVSLGPICLYRRGKSVHLIEVTHAIGVQLCCTCSVVLV